MGKIDDMEIWRSLIGFTPEPNKYIHSPFRNDKKPNSRFCYDKQGVLHFWDAYSDHNGKTALQMYSIIHNLTKLEAYLECKKKFLRNTPIKKEIFIQDSLIIKPIFKLFDKNAREYWDKLGVTNRKNISQVSKIIYETDTSIKTVKEEELCFYYKFKNGWKIYRPYSKKGKWLSKVSYEDVWIYNENSPLLVLLKSSKCFKVIESIVTELNINVTLTHLQSEVIVKDINKIPNLKLYNNYSKKVYIADNDTTGIEAANTLSKVGFDFYFTDKGKDLTEYLELTSRKELITWFLKIINKYV